ncbi:dephospho-CoA kinase [Paenibacillus macquariensis]|uniref:Dephospho-CoA kinase n=1 Tax=Paenibacillus macquariensis TaxID=948756 RepID=A0ABY1JXR8_9BACL|nr:dephospho-CoA kinase [Paenibacillus macquariensis]MEC0089270.1 dephospho-CoA kinase [Paenibacillus macquariensis]OAB33322.1 dephospho-CoA kinase [Paenibacillus macquariensis subsp. macquariensis]SIQ95085.1 dephospho-CoA kinase [Paenibacillus macquariensis]
MNIGLTGGIATGKSTVSSLLVKKGAMLVDADAIAREVMLPGHPVLAAVAEFFGQGILQEDGTLDRKKLGNIVFDDKEALKALNDISHPEIRKEIRKQMMELETAYPERLVVVDIPLLYESGLQSMFEEVWVVYAPRDVQKERLMKRDLLSIGQAEARLQSQMDIEQKKSSADRVIDNSHSLEVTEQQVNECWLQMRLI